jgi:hypothetical protein
MRTLLLIVLGLGLVVFLTLRKDPENTAVSEASADGVMLAEEGVVRAAPPPEPEAAPASATASAGPAGPAQAPAQPAAPAEAPQPAAGSAPAAAPALLAPDSAEELELAQELAHRPDSLASWLGKRPELERSARGEFASALAMAVLGRGEAASAMLERLERSGGVQAAELLALRALLSTQSARPVPASASAPSALVHAADLARAVREGRDALSRGEHASSVRAYSAALRAEIDAPWAADPRQLGEWTEALRRAQAQHQWSPRGSWKALEISVQNGDSLIAIRKRALAQSEGLTTCTGLIAKANGLRNEAAIHPGMKLRVPTDKRSQCALDAVFPWGKRGLFLPRWDRPARQRDARRQLPHRREDQRADLVSSGRGPRALQRSAKPAGNALDGLAERGGQQHLAGLPRHPRALEHRPAGQRGLHPAAQQRCRGAVRAPSAGNPCPGAALRAFGVPELPPLSPYSAIP